MTESRSQVAGAPVWSDDQGSIAVRFVGRGPKIARRRLLDLLAPGESLGLARLEQIHSARLVEGHDGPCGAADALITSESSLALSVVTADCVPVLAATSKALTAVHAGWRGIEAGVVANAIEALLQVGGPETRATATAWIGPAIGACCYEVSGEVAARVAAASCEAVVVPQPGARPHLNLVSAVARQLEESGITRIRRTEICTRCHPEWLWSYRREGPRAGRNLAFVWRRSSP